VQKFSLFIRKSRLRDKHEGGPSSTGLQPFTVSMKKKTEWFGLEVARIVVDECLTPQPD
jgi:hypothetical protein